MAYSQLLCATCNNMDDKKKRCCHKSISPRSSDEVPGRLHKRTVPNRQNLAGHYYGQVELPQVAYRKPLARRRHRRLDQCDLQYVFLADAHDQQFLQVCVLVFQAEFTGSTFDENWTSLACDVATCHYCKIYIETVLSKSDIVEYQGYSLEQQTSGRDLKEPVILWWTPFTGEKGRLKKCGNYLCYFTEDRNFHHHPLTKAFVFYGSKLDLLDLPLPRNGPSLDWSLLHEESPKNVPALSHKALLSLFNYSSTFSRYSHVPLTLQYLHSMESLIETKYFVPTQVKNQLLSELSPVVYIQSGCNTPSQRDAYVEELMKYIPVDSYGACLQNKKLPENLLYPSDGTDSDEFLHFISRYKFALAFENAVCEDYISEKLWRPLAVGSVPIYMGSPSDWLPNPDSAILISEFESPEKLAHFLKELNNDTVRYESYLGHKLDSVTLKITNKKLLSALSSHSKENIDWGVNVEQFECYICQRAHIKMKGDTELSVLNESHYLCPPPSLHYRDLKMGDFWSQMWKVGRCEARVVRNFINQNKTAYTSQEFTDALKNLLKGGDC
uniref:Fucosyltransferase n=1 Tax=Timema douglasi TaxID=61478 RepID=A0A7R8VH42_TIMDO|nr:unnamed protein product [Timema douglasi]